MKRIAIDDFRAALLRRSNTTISVTGGREKQIPYREFTIPDREKQIPCRQSEFPIRLSGFDIGIAGKAAIDGNMTDLSRK